MTMRYDEIKTQFKNQPIFSLRDIKTVEPNFRRATLSEWIKRGNITKIRQEWYCFSNFQPTDYEYFYISNKIYSPSYISLESMLEFYNVIPEAVQQITAISTQKTKTFATELGTYVFRKVKTNLFWGYKIVEYNNIGITIATLEKTILDYLYLNNINSTLDFEGLRFNKDRLKENIDKKIMGEYLVRFNNSEVEKKYIILKEYLNA
jgi:predicted transcriptional regulator of viral defense system